MRREGGLYHAAAALGIPAVAIFGGWVSPANQGYDGEDIVNLYEHMNGESPCGQRVPCPHCRAALDRITPQTLIQHIRRRLN
jgi:ADP-heptose:LPS heptosyltransferase